MLVLSWYPTGVNEAWRVFLPSRCNVYGLVECCGRSLLSLEISPGRKNWVKAKERWFCHDYEFVLVLWNGLQKP